MKYFVFKNVTSGAVYKIPATIANLSNEVYAPAGGVTVELFDGSKAKRAGATKYRLTLEIEHPDIYDASLQADLKNLLSDLLDATKVVVLDSSAAENDDFIKNLSSDIELVLEELPVYTYNYDRLIKKMNIRLKMASKYLYSTPFEFVEV